jgi:hypothetical protein
MGWLPDAEQSCEAERHVLPELSGEDRKRTEVLR